MNRVLPRQELGHGIVTGNAWFSSTTKKLPKARQGGKIPRFQIALTTLARPSVGLEPGLAIWNPA